MYSTVCAVLLLAHVVLAFGGDGPEAFRAGEDSLRFNVSIGDDERRGEQPHVTPMQVKRQCAELLRTLREDEIGLKAETEHNIESYFTVADAFEADGLLVQAVDYLTDLQHKLQSLRDARQGRNRPESLIANEEDILPFRCAHNIHVFDGKYMAGAQPTEKGYRWLRSKGATTIINLRLPSDHERQFLKELGITYIHIPWSDEQAPSVEQVQEMLQAVRNSKGKVMQHCLRGIGRDMTMASCYMIAVHGKSADELIESGRREAARWGGQGGLRQETWRRRRIDMK